MKKAMIPLVAALLVGAYFLFFVKSEPKTDDARDTTTTTATNAADSTRDSMPFGDPPSELEKQREQMMHEHARPEAYVKLSFDYRKNILGETVVEGAMTNNAQHTTYRDVRLMVYFDDAESTVLDSASQVIFEAVAPGAKADFRIKEKGPKRGKSIRVQVADAAIVEGE